MKAKYCTAILVKIIDNVVRCLCSEIMEVSVDICLLLAVSTASLAAYPYNTVKAKAKFLSIIYSLLAN